MELILHISLAVTFSFGYLFFGSAIRQTEQKQKQSMLFGIISWLLAVFIGLILKFGGF